MKSEHTIERELLESMPRRVRFTAATNRTRLRIYGLCVTIAVLAAFLTLRSVDAWEALQQHGVSTQAKIVQQNEVALKNQSKCICLYEFRVGKVLVAGSQSYSGACSARWFQQMVPITYLPENPHIYWERYATRESPASHIDSSLFFGAAVICGCMAWGALMERRFQRAHRLLRTGDAVVGYTEKRPIELWRPSTSSIAYRYSVGYGKSQRFVVNRAFRPSPRNANKKTLTILRDVKVPERSQAYFQLRPIVEIIPREKTL